MTAQKYMISLTRVRPLGPNDPPRNEHEFPEVRCEIIGPADYDAAMRIFRAYCNLPMVRNGRQRAKIVPITGSENPGHSRHSSVALQNSHA